MESALSRAARALFRMKATDAPNRSRNRGSKGSIISLLTSLSRLTLPTATIAPGNRLRDEEDIDIGHSTRINLRLGMLILYLIWVESLEEQSEIV